MKLGDIIHTLEQWAPPALQESYDNSGLLVGHPEMTINGAMIALDATEAVIDEAISKGVSLVIAHHPIVFSGLKRFTGDDYVQRTIMKAIKHDIAIYAIHTNLDNIDSGVNAWICELLGIKGPKILQPKEGLLEKLVVFAPLAHAEAVRNAMFAAGAGEIGNYDECSFNVEGEGSFRGNEQSQPQVGERGQRHIEKEVRIEVIVEKWKMNAVLAAMIQVHPYEEVAYYRMEVKNRHQQVGAGMLGDLDDEMTLFDFFDHVKATLGVRVIKHTCSGNPKVSKIAVCGGSGFFLLGAAKSAKADVFVTSDVKYHQFFDAEDSIILADIGHWESEHRTGELLQRVLNEKFPTFAVHLSQTNTNPVNYY